MKNKEKYIDFIIKAFADVDVDGCVFRREYVLKQKNCAGFDCAECNMKTAEWLEEEYTEPINLTDDEIVILKNIDKKYNWIVRNDYGYLWAHISKPVKYYRGWLDEKLGALPVGLCAYNHLFTFIKWEDEPYNIDELLKQNGVER